MPESSSCGGGSGVDVVADLESHLRIGAVVGDHAVAVVFEESALVHHRQRSTSVTECHPLPGANIMDHLTFCINVGTEMAHDILIDTETW